MGRPRHFVRVVRVVVHRGFEVVGEAGRRRGAGQERIQEGGVRHRTTGDAEHQGLVPRHALQPRRPASAPPVVWAAVALPTSATLAPAVRRPGTLPTTLPAASSFRNRRRSNPSRCSRSLITCTSPTHGWVSHASDSLRRGPHQTERAAVSWVIVLRQRTAILPGGSASSPPPAPAAGLNTCVTSPFDRLLRPVIEEAGDAPMRQRPVQRRHLLGAAEASPSGNG